MSTYTKVFADTYPNGWEPIPSTATPYTTDIKNNEDATLRSIEEYLYDNPIGDISAASIKDLSDVSSTSPTAGQTLIWDDTSDSYVPGTPASSIATMSDVDYTTPPTNGQTLVYDDTSETFKPGTPVSSVFDLSDVETYGWYENGYVLEFVGQSTPGSTKTGHFVLQKLQLEDIGSIDPNLTTSSPYPADGDGLVYDSTNLVFTNRPVVSPTIDSSHIYEKKLVVTGAGDDTSKVNFKTSRRHEVNIPFGYYFHSPSGGMDIEYAYVTDQVGGQDVDLTVLTERTGASITSQDLGTTQTLSTSDHWLDSDGVGSYIAFDAYLYFNFEETDLQGNTVYRQITVPMGGGFDKDDVISVNLVQEWVYDDPQSQTPISESTDIQYYVDGFSSLFNDPNFSDAYLEIRYAWVPATLPSND